MSPRPHIEQRRSPNHGARLGGPTDILLLHYTGMPGEERALDWLCDERSGVSSHYFVFEDGRIVQLVDEGRRAWHAGVSSWAGETDINSRSIGIEIANPGHEFGYRAFPAAQIAAVIALSRGILARHPISPERVLAHSDVAPMRKEDPGELFPWPVLHAEGIGRWVPPVEDGMGATLRRGQRGAAVADMQREFRRYGYGLAEDAEFGPETEAVVRAFQRHFRPALVDGVADPSTLATLARLRLGLAAKA